MNRLLTLFAVLLFAQSLDAAQLYYVNANAGANRRELRGTETDDSASRTFARIDQNFNGRGMARNTDSIFFTTVEGHIYSSALNGAGIKQLIPGVTFGDLLHVAADDTLVLFQEASSAINSVNPDGTGWQTLINFSTNPTPAQADSFAVDWNTRLVYVGDTNLNRIVTYQIDDPNAAGVEIMSMPNNVDFSAMKVSGGKLYAGIRDLGFPGAGNRVMQSDLDGSNAVDILTLGSQMVRGMDIDGTDLYFSSNNDIGGTGDGGIFHATTAGVGLAQIIESDGTTVFGISFGPTVEPLTKNFLVDCSGSGIVSCGALDEDAGVDFAAGAVDEGGPLVTEYFDVLANVPQDLQDSLAASNFTLATGPSDFDFWNMAFNGEFTGTALVTFQYDEADLLIPELELVVYHYDGIGWEELPVYSRDTTNDTITVVTTSFSPFTFGQGEAQQFPGGVPEPGTGLLVVLGLLLRRPLRRV